jgi:hypothetical protein
MKSRLIIITFLAICAVLSSKAGCEPPEAMQAAELNNKLQTTEKPAKVPELKVEQGQAEITFENTVHDFGDVLGKSKNTCEFKFKNTGTGELKIGDVRSTCGCTAFELSKKDYLPGESGTIKVQYSAPVRPGTAQKHLYVPSNAKNNPRVELTVKANIILKVRVEPLNLTLAMDKENAGCPPLTLSSIDGVPFKITSFHSTNEVITVEIDPNTAATKFVLHPKVDIEKLTKRLNGHINIKLTHPQCDTVSASYTTPPLYKSNPASIIIQNADPTEPIRRQVLIESNYGSSFQIESVYSEKGTMQLLSQKNVREGIQLEVQINPPPQASKTRFFTDWLYIQIKGGERVQVHASMWFAKTKETKQSAL